MKPHFITAIATPLHEDDSLNRDALLQHIRCQIQAGINGLLVGGTMGAMQMLTADTYQELVGQSIAAAGGRCEILVGAGDTSFSRTAERIQFLNRLPIDGVVVLPPFFLTHSQEDLIDYFEGLAGESKRPLFLYDQPLITHCKIQLETAARLSTHPNIRGIKCSDTPAYARQLMDRCNSSFRVVMAAPTLIDVFLRSGVSEHVDGVYCLCPEQIVALGRAAALGDWEHAAHLQRDVNRVSALLAAYGVWPTFTAIMHELGVDGCFKPRPRANWPEPTAREFEQSQEAKSVIRFLRQAPPAQRAIVRPQIVATAPEPG